MKPNMWTVQSGYTINNPAVFNASYLGTSNMQAVGAVHLDTTLVVRVYQLVSDRVVRHRLRHVLVAAKNDLPAPTRPGGVANRSTKNKHQPHTNERRVC